MIYRSSDDNALDDASGGGTGDNEAVRSAIAEAGMDEAGYNSANCSLKEIWTDDAH